MTKLKKIKKPFFVLFQYYICTIGAFFLTFTPPLFSKTSHLLNRAELANLDIDLIDYIFASENEKEFKDRLVAAKRIKDCLCLEHKSLYLQDLSLTCLPEKLADLHSLDHLFLQNNRLKSIPPSS